MKIAHISDLHTLDLTGVPWTRFINKRATGMINLVGRRKGAHPLELLDALVDAVNAEGPDHVVITGDLTNLALSSEFLAARQRIERLGGYDRVSLVPGNHDVYTRGSTKTRRFESFFGPWLWRPEEDQLYPSLKCVGDAVEIIGFSSARVRAPFIATGHVSAAQLDRFHAHVTAGHLAGRFAIALVHHNLHSRSWRKNLMHGFKDREAFLATLAEGGVNLVLHGHTHVAHAFQAHGMDVIGCGSSTWHTDDPAHRARFNLYEIAGGALKAVRVKTWDPLRQAFIDLPEH